ncbi:MAG: hypothetical protein IIW17_01920, partial [Clostridia bacterium]|nr:hypothetical protein [Clostridia bacterium]
MVNDKAGLNLHIESVDESVVSNGEKKHKQKSRQWGCGNSGRFERSHRQRWLFSSCSWQKSVRMGTPTTATASLVSLV